MANGERWNRDRAVKVRCRLLNKKGEEKKLLINCNLLRFMMTAKVRILNGMLFIILVALAGCNFSTGDQSSSENSAVKADDRKGSIEKIIFDTDVGGDVDDAGALAVLHALADRKEIEILAIGVVIGHEDAVPYVDAVNTWYGRPDLPIGTIK